MLPGAPELLEVRPRVTRVDVRRTNLPFVEGTDVDCGGEQGGRYSVIKEGTHNPGRPGRAESLDRLLSRCLMGSRRCRSQRAKQPVNVLLVLVLVRNGDGIGGVHCLLVTTGGASVVFRRRFGYKACTTTDLRAL